MRGVEILVGGLLVASGLAGPGLVDPGSPAAGAGVTGAAAFADWWYAGTAQVVATDAALRMEGSLHLSIPLSEGSVTVHEFTENRATIALPKEEGDRGISLAYESGRDETRTEYANATVRIDSGSEGRFHLWPTSDPVPSNLTLGLGPTPGTQASASAKGEQLRTEHWHLEHEVYGPIFALSNGPPAPNTAANATEARFEHLNVAGGVRLVLEDAAIAVEHPEGRETFVAGTEETQDGIAPGVPADKHTIVVVELPRASFILDSQDLAGALFLAHEPTWNVEGAVSFRAEDGYVRAGQENRTTREAEVRVSGNTTLDLAEGGPSDELNVGDPNQKYRWPKDLLPKPTIHAKYQSDASSVAVDGHELQAAASTPALPDGVSTMGKVIGILLLVWGVARRALVFVAMLFIRDPLNSSRRRQIHAFLKSVGMGYLREIHRATGIPLGTLSYHLRVLRQTGYVASIQSAGYTVYFVTSQDLSREDMRRLALLADPTRRQIAETLIEQPALSQQSLAESLELTVASISRQLAKLVEAGLVLRRGQRESTYRPAPLLREWLGGTG